MFNLLVGLITLYFDKKKYQEMGNCLRPNDRDRNSDEFEPIPTLQTSTKNTWFKLLKVETIPYFESSYLNHKYEHPSFLQIDKDIDRTYPNEA